MVEELAKHWEELGRRQESESTMEEDRMEGSEVRSDICEMVTFDDVVGILKQLKRGKATGPDGIRYEDGGDYGAVVQPCCTASTLPEGLEEELRSATLQGWGSRDSDQL